MFLLHVKFRDDKRPTIPKMKLKGGQKYKILDKMAYTFTDI